MNYYIEKDNKKHILLIILAAVTGIVYTVIFHKAVHLGLGLNYPIFMLLVFVFTYIMLNSDQFNKKTYFIFTLINFLYAAGYAVYMNSTIRSLSFIAVPVLYILTVLMSQRYKIDLIKILKSIFVPFVYIFTYFINIAKNLFAAKKMSAQRRNVLIGILLSVILLIIIVPLMLSSDILLNSIFHNWFKNFEINIGDIIYYVFFFALTSAYSYGFIRFMMERRITLNENTEKYSLENAPTISIKDEKNFNTQILIVLSVATVAYAVFCALQSAFLIGGSVYGLPNNFDYAQYARSGFFQLVALTVINIAIILLIFGLTGKKTTTGIKRLLYIFTFLTLLLAISSFYRMHLYEAEYGYTILRLLVYIILIYEFVVIMLIFVKISKTKFPFIKTAFIIGLVFYLATAYLNIDAYVAKKNIDRYFDTGKIDVFYLSKLSFDASEQIIRLENETNSEIKTLIQNKKFYMQDYVDKNDFRAYNYSIKNAIKVYNVNAEDIYKVTIINNGYDTLNQISITSDKETQVMASRFKTDQSCSFFFQENETMKYVLTLTDENNKTYNINITLDFKEQNDIVIKVNNYDNNWHAEQITD